MRKSGWGAFLRTAARKRLARSARDLSEGGLVQAAVESMFAPDGSRLGAALHLEVPRTPLGALFGEAPARALVSAAPENADGLAELADRRGVPLTPLGAVGGDALSICVNGARTIHLPAEDLWTAFGHGLARAVAGEGRRE